MLDRLPTIEIARVATHPDVLVQALSRALGRYTPAEVAALLNRSACRCSRRESARARAIIACATQPSEWWGRLDYGTEWRLGLRLYYRLPTIVSWYLSGLTPEEVGARISMFGGSASALRALDAAARCIASRLNDRHLPPVRGSDYQPAP